MYAERELRAIERALYPNKELNVEDFPSLPCDVMKAQEMDAMLFDYNWDYGYYSFAYIREHNSSWFIDIYTYYCDLNHQICSFRVIIAPGYQMDLEHEKDFELILDGVCMAYNTRCIDGFVDKMKMLAPELKLIDYPNFSMVLGHIYYSCFRSGIREILWKAGGLCHIAKNISLFEDWDMLANNVESAFDMPLKLLRKFNSLDAIEHVIKTADGRDNAGYAYAHYHRILNDIDILNDYQIRYLCECADKEIKEKDVDKKLIKTSLASIESDFGDWEDEEYEDGHVVYEYYMRYRSMLEASEYTDLFPLYPSLSLDDLGEFRDIQDTLKKYIKNGDEIDRKFAELSWVWERKYLFEDNDFQIVIPRKAKHIFEEANHQHNCLYQYLDRIMSGYSTVVFMRKKAEPQKSFITIEINMDGKISQAYMTCNKYVSGEKEKAFINRFAAAKGLVCELFSTTG